MENEVSTNAMNEANEATNVMNEATRLNTSLFVSSLRYIQKHKQVSKLASWIYDELKTINYTDGKLLHCILNNDSETTEDLICLRQDDVLFLRLPYEKLDYD